MAITIEPREVQVRTTWNVIVTAFPWLYVDGPVSPRKPVFGRGSNPQNWIAKAQNTTAYGRFMINLAKTYGIKMIAPYWTQENPEVPRSPLRNFKDSIRELAPADFGDIRFIYIFDVGSLAWGPDVLRRAVLEHKNEILAPTYARLRDTRGALRPVIMLWGKQVQSPRASFKLLIEQLRAEFNASGVEPYIILTYNGIFSGRDDIICSVDAFYHASLYHNYDANADLNNGPRPPALDTRTSTDLTVTNLWKPHRAALQGKTNFKTGLPVVLMPGAQPQLDVQDHRRGIVYARSKADVEYMFAKSKEYAPTVWSRRTADTVELERWIVLTDLNEWREGHTIEPCIRHPPEQSENEPYNANHEYGDDFMEAFREAYKPEVRVRMFPLAGDPQI